MEQFFQPIWYAVRNLRHVPHSYKTSAFALRNARDSRDSQRHSILHCNSSSPLSGRAQSIITDLCEFNAPSLSAFTAGCVLHPAYPNCLEAFYAQIHGKAACFSISAFTRISVDARNSECDWRYIRENR